MSESRRGAPRSVLVVDDDDAVVMVLEGLLTQDGLAVGRASTGREALRLLEERPFDAVVSDVRMPEMDGMALLREVKRRWPELPVVMMTAFGTIPLAVEAMKAGAAEFVAKPFERDELLYVVRKVLATRARDTPSAADEGLGGERPMIGAAPAMREVRDLIARAARSTATVLIRGESGTGKEVAARAIHRQSARAERPLVTIQCGALPDTLLESELFGYEKGAFTGALRRKAGRIELAQGGTVLLDEIGDITPAMQVKLLRVLQEKQVQRLGGHESSDVDVRFIAATHRDLEALIAAGEFRADLYYRLNVVPIWMPPLRQRGEDVAALAHHFCGALARDNGRDPMTLAPDAVAALRAQPWPGNVRQLQNFVERLVVLCDGPSIAAADVRRELARGPGPALAVAPATSDEAQTLDDVRLEAERDALERTLAACANNRTQAARLLGVSRRTLYYKLQEHGLS